MTESIGKEVLCLKLSSAFGLIHEKGQPRERILIRPFCLACLGLPSSVLVARCHCHSLWAAGPTTLPHFCFMCFSQRWSLIHLSLREAQTPAMLQSASGGSLSRMHSKASSGKSKTDISATSSTFSTLQVTLFLFRDILYGIWKRKPLEKMWFVNSEMVRKDNSFQKKGDSNLISVAHGGSGLRGRDFKKMRKGTQVKNK